MMKISGSRIAFFVFGVAVFTYLVVRFGVDQIAMNIHRAGWSLLYVILVWFAIYLLNAVAWKLVLGGQGKKVTFVQLFMVTVSGFVINYITPLIALGGEPYKVKALSGVLGGQQSLSAVVLYRMVHLLGHMVLLLVGIIAAILFLSLPMYINGILGGTALLIFLIIMLTLIGHRDGIFKKFENVLTKVPLLRRFTQGLHKYQADLQEMDRIITDVYHNDRGRFILAVVCEFCSRICMGIEVYLVLHGIDVETTIVSALFLYVVYSVIINLLFFIPLNLGAREGGLALGLGSLALPPLLGVYLGIVMRIREFFWILIGLLFILLTTDREKTSSAKAI
jgi:uncharacterized protein (TIRG00374 family)